MRRNDNDTPRQTVSARRRARLGPSLLRHDDEDLRHRQDAAGTAPAGKAPEWPPRPRRRLRYRNIRGAVETPSPRDGIHRADPDSKALERAQRKTTRAGVSAVFD